MGVASQGVASNQTPNTVWNRMGSQSYTAKRVRTKGKQPRLSSKVSKYRLSVEGSGIPQTARRLAQKQPSFKESVTAHWSTGILRRKFIEAQIDHRRQRCSCFA